MTPEAALCEVLERVAAVHGAAVLVTDQELSGCPAGAVEAMQSHGLLTKASPASSAVCPGCEHDCVMPVYVPPDTTCTPEPFIVCDERDDINRVPVPIGQLEQWQISGTSIADLLANLLDLRRPGTGDTAAGRWEVGLFKSTKNSSHLVLLADGGLTLSLAGHSIALADVLKLKGNALTVERRKLTLLVNQPVGGGGDKESRDQRCDRLRRRVAEAKAKGTRDFLRVVAAEEDISVSRLKQLLK
jgi:hypothetical protein